MSKVGIYQTTAARYGTVIEPCSPGFAPTIGGGITKHPIARDAAVALTRDLRQLGAEARVTDDDNAGERAFVYLSGCSFMKGDRLG